MRWIQCGKTDSGNPASAPGLRFWTTSPCTAAAVPANRIAASSGTARRISWRISSPSHRRMAPAAGVGGEGHLPVARAAVLSLLDRRHRHLRRAGLHLVRLRVAAVALQELGVDEVREDRL